MFECLTVYRFYCTIPVKLFIFNYVTGKEYTID